MQIILNCILLDIWENVEWLYFWPTLYIPTALWLGNKNGIQSVRETCRINPKVSPFGTWTNREQKLKVEAVVLNPIGGHCMAVCTVYINDWISSQSKFYPFSNSHKSGFT